MRSAAYRGSSLKQLGFNLLVGLGAVIVTLVAAEGIVRLVAPQYILAVCVHEWDPEIGFRQRPGAGGRLKSTEFDVDIRISSQGLRDRVYSYAAPPNTVRILCLGNSFTFG